ncbi:MAG: ABC transporter ATP-binding protein [Betaproteobacteria bacterium]|uniref:Leucine/isoleucine/valine transporter subunit membrane component of ABC superfamily n=1 Tax=Thiomonas delicata TaxID=364030 RepID=A0A238D627_THIDL|nr:ABC transporter ATP-binding protein [Thiomonas delicata]MDE2128138.1 ABC transporter ATP-binding protein [Betaproteobacteria bacterium]SBP88624.1 leucine/isoleucine/valine transporter subunit; membrane component of ABC superfamily [Thiomonas delicata]
MENKQTHLVGFLIAAVALLALPLGLQFVGDAWVRIAAFALLYIMLALGLNIVVGLAGLLDLGYIAFYAVGAYMFALLSSNQLTSNFDALGAMFPNGFDVTIWIVIPLGAGLAALFGILLGTPVLKLRGDYLAIVTLGFGEIIRIFMNNLNAPVNITNGPQGISGIHGVRIFGWHLNQNLDLGNYTISSVTQYYWLFLVLVTLTVVICFRLQDSRIGRAWMAMREDEIAAKAMGINTRNMKLLAFSMGATFGGVAGTMFAAFQGFVSPESFSLMESINVLAMVVIGGMGNIPGVIMGAILLSVLPEALRYTGFISDWQQHAFNHVYVDTGILRQLVYSLAMILVMILRPKGLWPAPEHGKGMAELGIGNGSGNGSGSKPAVAKESA